MRLALQVLILLLLIGNGLERRRRRPQREMEEGRGGGGGGGQTKKSRLGGGADNFFLPSKLWTAEVSFRDPKRCSFPGWGLPGKQRQRILAYSVARVVNIEVMPNKSEGNDLLITYFIYSESKFVYTIL